MKFSKRALYVLIILLIILNIILRYPTTPHEIGWDSFAIHIAANSVSEFGYAKWWIHPASIFGFYPYSYASVVPFVLSGISQCAGLGMESTIWLFCVLIGISSAFTAYLMAGAIKDNNLFKYLVAFAYSTSTGILWLTTWSVSTRGIFIVLLPLFIYLLMKCRTSTAKYSTLTFILLVVLVTTHHLFYFIIPLAIAYFIVTIFYKLKRSIKFDRFSKKVVYFALPICFIGLFAIPFFTRSFIEGGSRYVWLEMQLFEYARMIGLLGVFIVGGLIYLMLKHDKSFEEWFLIIALLILTPLLYVRVYTKWFFLAFAFLLIGISLSNIAKAHTSKKKNAAVFIVILLLLSASFTGYYQYLHFLNEENPNKRYMEERTYVGALWINDNVNEDKNVFAGEYGSYIPSRIFAISEVPTLTGASFNDLSYGFVDPNKLEIEQVYSPLSVGFYLHNPYREVRAGTRWYVSAIEFTDINRRGSYAQRYVPMFNLSYFVENEDVSSKFSKSVQQTRDNIYNNGKIRIWDLEEGKC